MERKKAIQIIRATCHTDEEMKALESLIPELHESEDEKIVKFLRHATIHSATLDAADELFKEYGIKCTQVLAYLKKQEQKHLDGCFTCDEYKKGYEAGRLHGFTAGYNKAKQEQKPAWSEEDEKMVKFYEDDYDNNLGNMPMRDVIENRIKFKDWLLKRLKFLRPSWKPTEEQMKVLRGVAYYCGNSSLSPYSISNKTLASLYNDLQKISI